MVVVLLKLVKPITGMEKKDQGDWIPTIGT
jgi:hypothetical protein